MYSVFDKLKRLSPAERIKKIRELENKKKKEIEEAEKLLLKALDDLKRDEILKDVEIPQVESHDISEMFNEEESLEQAVQSQQIQQQDVQINPYMQQMESEIKDIYNQLNQLSYNNNWSEEDFETFYQTSERLNEINQNFEEKAKQGYTMSQDVTNQMVLSQQVQYNIRKYREFGK